MSPREDVGPGDLSPGRVGLRRSRLTLRRPVLVYVEAVIVRNEVQQPRSMSRFDREKISCERQNISFASTEFSLLELNREHVSGEIGPIIV